MGNHNYKENPPDNDRPVVICDGTGLSFATIDVSCKGGNTFTLSTGTTKGTCEVIKDKDSGNVTSGYCATPEGNNATASCGDNGGEGACGKTEGKGSCKEAK